MFLHALMKAACSGSVLSDRPWAGRDLKPQQHPQSAVYSISTELLTLSQTNDHTGCPWHQAKSHPHGFAENRLVGLLVKASPTRAEDPGFDFRLRRGDFSGSSHTSDLKLALQWLPCQAPGVTGSALGLVGSVSVYCDWVRQKV